MDDNVFKGFLYIFDWFRLLQFYIMYLNRANLGSLVPTFKGPVLLALSPFLPSSEILLHFVDFCLDSFVVGDIFVAKLFETFSARSAETKLS